MERVCFWNDGFTVIRSGKKYCYVAFTNQLVSRNKILPQVWESERKVCMTIVDCNQHGLSKTNIPSFGKEISIYKDLFVRPRFGTFCSIASYPIIRPYFIFWKFCYFSVCHLLGLFLDNTQKDPEQAKKVFKVNCDTNKWGQSCYRYAYALDQEKKPENVDKVWYTYCCFHFFYPFNFLFQYFFFRSSNTHITGVKMG